MNIADAINQRRSVRGFTSQPVSRETLEQILKTASRAPSALNTQPWEVFVLAGEVLENIRAGVMKALLSGQPPRAEVAWEHAYDGDYRTRQVTLGKSLFKLMDIQRDDKQKRMEWMARGFRFFDAPAAIIVGFDDHLPFKTAASDLGGFIQTLCLAALDAGLGTCINGQGVMYPDIIRAHADIPASKKMFLCVAIGYEDPDFPANQLVSEREPVDNFTYWCGI